ncbi:methionine ABC transporter permease MetI [Heliobacillus mobilis]|uniref:Methionine ABC transporter permease MetI n=1 Tax=Heliobacterium mobile TaxID=28064 RepID=A0A6I3SIV6_HELMO|nr:methionine ABC transporter permease [Heliobacterium mobile]MTV48780.1 methionine ABC transporter permease MetI [Heliobacterium mobile]
MVETYLQSAWETFYMVLISSTVATVLGIPLGILLVVTEKGSIGPNRLLNNTLGFLINVFRSIPFIILLVAILPLTKVLVGSRIGTTAAIVPLTIAAIPFVARLIESSLKEINKGIIEAARAMGATPWQIIRMVLLPEALPGILLGIIITFVTLIGYSAMAGAVGGGGLGDLAIREGYMRNNNEVTWVTVVILVVMVQVFQSIGDFLTSKIRKNRGLL